MESVSNYMSSDALRCVAAHGGEFHKCRPGFTPAQNDRYMCIAEYYNGSDVYRLFYLGQELKSIEQDKLYFPELSHA